MNAPAAPETGARGRGRLLPNLLLALAALVAFLGIAEAAARLVDLRPAAGAALANPPWLGDRWLLPREDYRKRLQRAGMLSRYYELYQWDRWLFYRLRPRVRLEMVDPFSTDAALSGGRFTVETNAHGFRSRDFAERAPAGRRRIVALGDSSTFGWGVEAHESYPERMRTALATRLGVGEEAIETLNLGVPGYSTFQGRVLLEREALPLAPDLVTWSYLANDGQLTGEADRAAFAQRSGAMGAVLAALHRSRAFETLEAWIALARTRAAPPAASEAALPGARNVASYDEAAQNVRDAVAAARRAGVPIVLVAHCVRKSVAAVLGTVAQQTGAPFLDATGLLDAAVPRVAQESGFAARRARAAREWSRELLERQPKLLLFLPDGCHPNALGHQLVGEALAEIVARELAPEGAP